MGLSQERLRRTGQAETGGKTQQEAGSVRGGPRSGRWWSSLDEPCTPKNQGNLHCTPGTPCQTAFVHEGLEALCLGGLVRTRSYPN